MATALLKRKGSTNQTLTKAWLFYCIQLENQVLMHCKKLLSISATAVYNWVKEFRELIPEKQDNLDLKEVEFDEIWHYVGSKKTKNGFGKLTIDQVNERLQETK